MPNIHYRSPLLLVFVACALVGAPVAATTLVPAEFGQMARESELIVHGTVVGVQAQVVGPRRTIESVVTLQVADTLKGTPAAQTVFRVPGGRIGRLRSVMVGAPQFAAGDEVFLFLKGRAPAIAMPYGLSQGVFRVARSGGKAAVTPAVVTGTGPVTRGDRSRRPLDPAAFASRVRQALDGAAPPDRRRAIPRPR